MLVQLEDIKVGKTNAEYEAEYDADTLIKAQEILNSNARKKRALVVIKKRNKATDEAMEQLQSKTTKRLGKVFGKE